MFPKGAADDGACALYAAWNSFYDSPFVKLVEPISDEVGGGGAAPLRGQAFRLGATNGFAAQTVQAPRPR
jgi:hypothetical protein